MTFRENWRRRGDPSIRGGNHRGGTNGLIQRRPSEGLCVHFQRGRCHWGDRCRFSHDTTERVHNGSSSTTHDPVAKNAYLDWKRCLRSGIAPWIYSGREHEKLGRFWNEALEILESDSRENHQLLAKDLVDEDLHGRDFILATIDADQARGSLRRFEIYGEPFLKVVTHCSLLNCLSVDSFVGSLYSDFGGTNGDRGINYLSAVCSGMINMRSEQVTSLDTVKLLLNVLHQLLSRIRRARFHDEVSMLIDLARKLVDQFAPISSKADIDGLESKIQVMESLVNMANRNILPCTAHDHLPQQGTGPILSSFPLDMQTPGGRHDNDFADISKVQILPTYGEVVSVDAEYLPSTNFLQPHILTDPLQRYIDSTFRLLRHDVFGSIKDAIRDLLQEDDLSHVTRSSNRDNTTHLYPGAQVSKIFINSKNGLEAIVSFQKPAQIRRRTSSEQSKWWQDSNRLEEGSLICFLSCQKNHKRLIFLEVTLKSTGQDQKEMHKSSLVSDRYPPSVTVKLAACRKDDLILLTELYREGYTGIVVEFHGLIPATFSPILKNLQRTQQEGDLAFSEWILPGRTGDEDPQTTTAPAYARKAGFRFSLAPITSIGDEAPRMLDPTDTTTIDIGKLQTQTGLDYGQCQGLIAALTREYALIQGPPGTGKSYLGVKLVQVLLGVKAKANLGPILVICYTNHALDQFLKHLLDAGIEKVIRIGGRSQAPELDGKNLRVVSGSIGKTRVESQALGKSYSALETCMTDAGFAMKPLHKSRRGLSWSNIEPFLRRTWPKIHRQLDWIDEEGWTTIASDPLLSWLSGDSVGAVGEHGEVEIDETRLAALMLQAEQNIYCLSSRERNILAKTWFKQSQELGTDLLFEHIANAAELRSDINAIHEEINRRALVQADVIGITTTALARNIETLRRVGSKVVLCEEAAEVMEAHVISALMPGVEHFVQIGDHRQLRPQISSYSLSLESSTGKIWQLDRSQFERRAIGEPGLKPAPVAQLNIQRRMRPEISQLIRRVYPRLEDHESVRNLPNVVGMRDNLFWLDHRCQEDSADNTGRVKSHSNQWEVDMATALVRHVVRQGLYKSTDLALLTPYTGQLRKLRASLGRDFEICLSERDLETLAADGIDDHEGPAPVTNSHKALEKKTLLQTLRLATVDNFQGEEAKVIIVSLVRSNQNRKVGFLRTENRINVLLSRAQHGMYLIGNAETYLNVPMWADVHSQLQHANAVGTELALSCPRHPETPILCAEPHDFERKSPDGGCGLPCTRRLEPCGHQCQAKCHSAVMHDGFACGKPCQRIRTTCSHACPKLCGEKCGSCMVKIPEVELPCGHVKESVFCHQLSCLMDIKCDVKVDKVVPRCGHTNRVGCFKDVAAPIYRCSEQCREVLSCGHNCSDRCGSCLRDIVDGRRICEHPECRKICDRPYGACNHRCTKPCHPGEVCGGCKEKCECSNKGDARVDFVEMKLYSEINLDENPIIVLGCGHFFTSESVDGVVGLDEVYTRDVDGKFNGLRDTSSSLATGIPSCPDCKQPIRQFVTRRYNRVVNRAVLDETSKRSLIKGRTDLETLETRLNDVEEKLKNPSARRSSDKSEKQIKSLLDDCRNIGKRAFDLSRDTASENQPVKVLMDAITICKSSSQDEFRSLLTQMKSLNIATPKFDNQISFGARLLFIRAQQIRLSEVVKSFNSRKTFTGSLIGLRPYQPSAESLKILKACQELIRQANEGSFYRIAIAASITFAKLSQLVAWHRRTYGKHEANTENREDQGSKDLIGNFELVRELLDAALISCERLGNCPELQEQVQAMLNICNGPRYEVVTFEELEEIKSAMLNGRSGIATHSGHWYNCTNGHPVSPSLTCEFAIGECGMPMEQARCPECGAPIGGQDHRAVEGVTRAREME
ncbi:Zinc finger C3H1-type domain-containing protein [Penicillium ucsense]|uniref:Zinc finger C3H1-type domain-containing protein n=1 Tax=Penicillium ucsense TaxID=2839758 RepID=A0A8J8W547_9EURO|nr:Zinc finger C3H1-type domain-containing protein [Penicillium ucsense]KAF7737074.1 Zinc finger C3H1-type domain-containing protein [Penicillium ucsense]